MPLEGLYKSLSTECFYSADSPTPSVRVRRIIHDAPAAMPPMDHKTEPTADSEPEPAMKNELKSNEDPKPEPTADLEPGLEATTVPELELKVESDQLCEQISLSVPVGILTDV